MSLNIGQKLKSLIFHDISDNTFEVIAREWHSRYFTNMTPKYSRRVLQLLERDIFPELGGCNIKSIKAATILAALRELEDKGILFTAHRAKRLCARIFHYAIASGYVTSNPVIDLQGALPIPKSGHMSAITEPQRIAEFVRRAKNSTDWIGTKNAVLFNMYTFLRPGEVRFLEWADVDLNTQEIRIPAVKMKMRRAHIVPLSDQVLEILKELCEKVGTNRYVFPSKREEQRAESPISSNGIVLSIRRLGYAPDEMSAHGLRTMASTMLHEQGWPSEAIERQLAHADSNSVRGIYCHAEYLDIRRKMMQHWADWLDNLK